jgi:CYTH domain-containing protein
MLSLEEAFITLARSTHERCIVLCDRGTMDCRSYMPEEEWEQVMGEMGTNTLAMRDERYDIVVHLVTAANGADQFYTTEGHAARSEPPEYAKELDQRIKNNWVGHPCFHVVDNGTDFRGKIRRVMSTICKFVGLQGEVGMSKRKFLVSPASIVKVEPKDAGSDADRVEFPKEITYKRFVVDHDYILRPEQDASHQLRLRRRGLNGQFTYSYTLRYPDLHGQRVELKRLVNRREYFDLLLQKDPAAQTVSKKRYSFLWQNCYMELDQFVSPHKGLFLLEFYAEKGADVSKMLPTFWQYEGEVTNDARYSMRTLAQRVNSSPVGNALRKSDDPRESFIPRVRTTTNAICTHRDRSAENRPRRT